MNILGTPLGSNSFVASYLWGKGLKHHLLLSFIKDVAAARFPREAEHMLKGVAFPRMSHILRSLQKNKHNIVGWMTEMDEAHLSAWMHCLTASNYTEQSLGPVGRKQLSDLLDLPAPYGGAGLQSLEASTDEEFLGSFAGIIASLISLCKKTELPVYIRIAEALETLEDPDARPRCSLVEGVREVNDKMDAMRTPLSDAETALATELVKGSRLVEVPGSYSPEKPDPTPKPITLPEPRPMSDYITAPCKHKCSVMKQIRHAKQALGVFSALNPIKQILLRATDGQCRKTLVQ